MLHGTNFLVVNNVNILVVINVIIVVINVILVVVDVIIVVINVIIVVSNVIIVDIAQSSGKDGWLPGADQSASTAPQ